MKELVHQGETHLLTVSKSVSISDVRRLTSRQRRWQMVSVLFRRRSGMEREEGLTTAEPKKKEVVEISQQNSNSNEKGGIPGR